MLTGKQRSYLRGQGNRLEPVIHIGKDGLTASVIEQVDKTLDDHELVKGRVLNNSLEESRDVAQLLADKCSAEVVQVIGNVFLIYKNNPEESVYNLP